MTAAAAYGSLRELLLEVYGRAPEQEELEWWFGRNPAGPPYLAVVDGESASAISPLPLVLHGEETPGALSLHAVTAPAARGRGTFSRLERENEAAAAAAGARVLIAFTTEVATRIFVGRLGWHVVARPRVWARLRLSRGGPRLRTPPLPPFREEDAAQLGRGGTHVRKDVARLEWRYRDAPRPYGRVDGPGGFAIVGVGRRGPFPVGTICELAGGARVLRRAARAVDARLVLGLPGRGRRLAYLAAGFVPTPWRLRFIGRRLDSDEPLPREWRLDLGDTDFF